MLEHARQDFARDGVVVLRGFFKDWITLLREGVAYNEKNPGKWFRNYTPDVKDGQFWGDYCNWASIPEFKDFVENSPAANIAKAVMGSQHARIFHEHVLVKNAGATKITPWHHDGPYYPVAAKQTLSMWIPLDPVARDSTIEFVAGSHLWGKEYTPQSFNGEYFQQRMQTERLPDIEAERDKYTILGWELEPGDAVAFDYLTVHGAPGNASQQVARRVVSFRWLGDDAVYVNRGGRTSPPYPHLVDKLQTGDPLPDEDFPIIV
ncbi:phytanoyl-CoA dioxygenase family protein [Pelistega europaea]|uniref:Phytanoyl-CoA dioxygenase n=1 Tax=Pelistega europaea TaxID=106147 RepID=A0A7Y4L7X8_9BURK|nr:phytanoyl-CoA dioxygenase family protein [Pelistega europaea]NOL48533.1 phytanoyl-CoA dioxygenase [Pelistega europaea]